MAKRLDYLFRHPAERNLDIKLIQSYIGYLDGLILAGSPMEKELDYQAIKLQLFARLNALHQEQLKFYRLDQEEWLGFTIIEDISNRKTLEQHLKKQYENQETIMHMIAHDLKSPLFNIQLAAGFLKENLEELQISEREKQEQASTLVNLIQDTCEKALLLIKELLLLGQLEATEEELAKTNLKAFIQFHLPNLRVAAQQKNIAVRVDAPQQPVYAQLNREKFRRVLENLLSNAAKFTPAGGQITLTLKKKGKKALLQVQDTGIGIPQALQPTIFHKFTKAGRNGTAGEPTTGLGLYIVKQIIEKHQGKVWVESQENAGTAFFIELP